MKDQIVELVRYRLDQAQEAVGDAAYLLEGQRSIRSVVNLAYYAMFYAALALLQTTGAVPSKHSGVIGLFDKNFVHRGILSKEHSESFHRAFDLRQASDYRVSRLPSLDETEGLLGRASAFVGAVKRYLHEQGYC